MDVELKIEEVNQQVVVRGERERGEIEALNLQLDEQKSRADALARKNEGLRKVLQECHYAVISPKGRRLLAEIDRKPPIGFKD